MEGVIVVEAGIRTCQANIIISTSVVETQCARHLWRSALWFVCLTYLHPQPRHHVPHHREWTSSIQSHPPHPLTINAVSQFTLYAVTRKGTKPDFHRSAPPALARELYEHFVSKVQAGYQAERVRDGVFQAMMDVALVNDGPVCTVECCVLLVGCAMLHGVVAQKRWLMITSGTGRGVDHMRSRKIHEAQPLVADSWQFA